MESIDENGADNDDETGSRDDINSKEEYVDTIRKPATLNNKANELNTIPEYAQLRPQILLEVLSAKSTRLVILSTYAIFIVSFIVDFIGVVTSISNYSYSMNPTEVSPSPTLISSYTTNVTVASVAAVLAIQVSVQQTNFSIAALSNPSVTLLTNTQNNPNCTTSLTYNFHLWACGLDQGCGNNFIQNSNIYRYNYWLFVYQSHETISVDLCGILNNDLTSFQISLLPTHLQNQESYLVKGVIQSYLIQMTITDNPSNLLVPLTPEVASSITYTMNIQSTLSGTNRIVNSAEFSRAFYFMSLIFTLTGIVGFSW